MTEFIPQSELENVKLLILDVDDTVTPFKSDGLMYQSAYNFIQNWQAQGLSLAFTTNQGGPACKKAWPAIAHNFPSFAQIERRNQIIRAQANNAKVHVSYAYFHKKSNTWLYPDEIAFDDRDEHRKNRKPSPNMLKLAMYSHNYKKDEVLYVGDRNEDQEAAKAAGIRFYRINMENQPLLSEEPETVKLFKAVSKAQAFLGDRLILKQANLRGPSLECKMSTTDFQYYVNPYNVAHAIMASTRDLLASIEWQAQSTVFELDGPKAYPYHNDARTVKAHIDFWLYFKDVEFRA